MQEIDIPLADGPLRALRFGDGPKIIVAAHGITASAMAWRAVAKFVPADYSLIALDLRGRGGSNALPGPFGMSAHAADIAAVAEHFGAPVILTGQSMGAYASLRAAVTRPELFSKLLLIDGGLPLPVPPDADPDAVLAVTIGPAVARLSQEFPSEQAYIEFFQAHPALNAEWSDDLTEYVRYDIAGEPGAIRSRVSSEAVSADGRDLLLNAASFGDDLKNLSVPTTLLYASKGMFGAEPGMLPQPLVEHWDALSPALTVELVPDANHYTILMTEGPAALIAERLTA